MSDRISFMGANYVARFVSYHMTTDWDEGNAATETYYRPIQTMEVTSDFVEPVPMDWAR